MIDVQNLEKTFGDRALFRDASLRVGPRDRIALVGPNGSGKTTLLEMVAGRQQPDAGTIAVSPSVTIGYLPQQVEEIRGNTILDEVVSAAPAHSVAGHRLEVLEREIEAAGEGEREGLLTEYAHLQQRFDELGGWGVEAEAKRILSGLSFPEEAHTRPAGELSGGWLMRVALAKLLLEAPDALLLDEPTNHLDLESLVWLEGFLRSYDGALLLVSHDRDFMNGIATRVVEIDGSRLISYTGDFEAFVAQRAQRLEQQEQAAKQQARRIAETERFINRFRYKASKARLVQSRIKALDKLERIEPPARGRRRISVGFPPPPRSGRVVAELDGVHFAYGEHPVYRGLDLTLERGDRTALVGPNGAGKTTLLKLLAGALTPQAGERRLGHNVSVGYFAQHALDALDPRNRVIEELQRAIPPGSTIRARDILGRVLFSGDDVDKPVSVLSGGERTRLALAKLLVSPLNFLCLDEPTNHLDLESRDVLEETLVDYRGTIVLITHDRHLIRSVANRIIEVQAGGVRSFPGDWDAYQYHVSRERSDAQEPAAPAPLGPRPRRGADKAAQRKVRADIRRVEAELDRVHGEMKELEAALEDPARHTELAPRAFREYERARARVRELEGEWERLTEGLDA